MQNQQYKKNNQKKQQCELKHPKSNKELLCKAGILVFWLFLWQLLAMAVKNHILLVGPVEVLKRLLTDVRDSAFWLGIGGSMLRIFAGFFLGSILGSILAICAAGRKWVKLFLKPFVTALRSIPVASFVVLFLIWWGSARLSCVISAVVVFPIFYGNLLEGLESSDAKMQEMAKLFSVQKWIKLRFLDLPALDSYLRASVSLGMGMAWKSGIAAELIGNPARSIGEKLYLSKVYLDTAGVLSWTVVIVLISFAGEKMILGLLQLVRKWLLQGMPMGAEHNLVQSVDAPANKEHIYLEICKIDKSFGEQQVLHHKSLICPAGRITKLKDPSGSGKTTLLRILAGLEKADGGELRWEKLEKGSVSFLFQEDRLLDDCNAVQNVAFVTGDPVRARAALLQLLPENCLLQPIRELSGGMKRRVALVRAVLFDSELLLLDEPFTGMDAETRQAAEQFIEAHLENRVGIMAIHEGV